MTYTEKQLKRFHKYSIYHKQSVLNSSLCGCFYCRQTFKPEEIKEWVDKGTTALCPKCGIDSVLPDTLVDKKIIKDPEFLISMYKYAFKVSNS